MADIEGIKTGELNFLNRAKNLSSKYKVPLLGSELSEIYIYLDNPTTLCFGSKKLVNTFNKGKFYSRITKFQNESLLKKAFALQLTKPKKILDTTGGLGLSLIHI